MFSTFQKLSVGCLGLFTLHPITWKYSRSQNESQPKYTWASTYTKRNMKSDVQITFHKLDAPNIYWDFFDQHLGCKCYNSYQLQKKIFTMQHGGGSITRSKVYLLIFLLWRMNRPKYQTILEEKPVRTCKRHLTLKTVCHPVYQGL